MIFVHLATLPPVYDRRLASKKVPLCYADDDGQRGLRDGRGARSRSLLVAIAAVAQFDNRRNLFLFEYLLLFFLLRAFDLKYITLQYSVKRNNFGKYMLFLIRRHLIRCQVNLLRLLFLQKGLNGSKN
jgi:hypothetical protein